MKNTVKIVLNIILQMIIIIGMVNSVQAAETNTLSVLQVLIETYWNVKFE